MCTTCRRLGINLEFEAASCGQLSSAVTCTQVKDVDNHDAPVEQTKVQRFPQSGDHALLMSWTASWHGRASGLDEAGRGDAPGVDREC